jgi:hypothetical protein
MRHIASAATGGYFAGIWKHFISGLLWESTAREGPARMEAYICPSWSWAAPQRHIGFIPRLNAEPGDVVRALDAQRTAKEVNPFGELSGAKLMLRGLIVRTVLIVDASLSPHFSMPALNCGRDGLAINR